MTIQGLQTAALLLAAMLPAFSARATTLNEADLPGGAFGSSYTSPTVVGAGVDAITGTGGQNVFDNFLFTALPSGAQQIRIDFAAPAGFGYSYSAGGVALYGTSFKNQWEWTAASRQVQVDYYKPTQRIVLDLLDGFTGSLYLVLNFTHGADLAYTISAPSNAVVPQVSAVPLPAGLLLIGSAVGALGLFGRRRLPAAA